LIRLADKYFRDQDANIVEVLAVEGHPYERLFERQYFLRSPIKHILFYVPFNLGKTELNDFVTALPE
jgi:hypothetical protein